MPKQIVTGTPRDTGPCWSCGETAGFVSVPVARMAGESGSRHKMVAIELQPRRFGTIVLLADGFRALDLEAGWIRDDERQEIRDGAAALYCRHWYACAARGMRRVGWTSAAVAGGRPINDPGRERRRAAKLAEDRARDRGYYR